MRISYKFLPKIFDQLEDFIGSIDYLPISNNQCRIDAKNKRHELIQEAKRTWLSIYLSMYEHQIQINQQQYEHLYKQIEMQLSTVTTNDSSSLLNKIEEYLTYRLDQLKLEISNQMHSIKYKLLRNRRYSLSTKKYIGVSPEPYLDLTNNPFNPLQWNQLCLGEIK